MRFLTKENLCIYQIEIPNKTILTRKDNPETVFLSKPLINMSNLITVNRFGKVLIWVWNRCIKKTAIPYEELDFHYPDWAFIITGCIFFGVVVGVTLLYFAFIKQ